MPRYLPPRLPHYFMGQVFVGDPNISQSYHAMIMKDLAPPVHYRVEVLVLQAPSVQTPWITPEPYWTAASGWMLGRNSVCQFMWDRVGDPRLHRVYSLMKGTEKYFGTKLCWEWFDLLGCKDVEPWKGLTVYGAHV